jgi:hypothetical protein
VNTSKFRSIPEYNQFKIPFTLEESSLLEWLNALSREESKHACFQLLRLLQTLNLTEIKPQKRLSFLNAIEEYLQTYIRHLKGVCWDVGYPLTIDEKVYAEVVTWNYLLLTNGFFMVAREISNKNASAAAFSKALMAKGQAQLQIAAVYAFPPDGFWKETYQMLIVAQKKDLLQIEVRKFKKITLGMMFKKLLVFQACDTNQFHARDMQTIFYFLDNVCQKVTLKPYDGDINALFSFDIRSDSSPKRCHERTHVLSATNYYFSPVVVALAIYSTLQKKETWKGKLKPINSTLFSRVIKTLGLGQRRRYTRIKDEYDVQGVIGFEDVINFLRTSRTSFLEEADETPFKKIKQATAELKIYIQNKDISLTMTNEAELSEKMSYHSIWHAPKSMENGDIKAPIIKNIHIFDSSAKGYLLYWNNLNIKLRAKIGDVFGLISKDKQRLEIALIRRISINETNHFRFGAEVIGFESEVVYICHPDNNEQYIWAIFIPGITLLDQTDTLIFSTKSFTVGDKIHIYRGNKKIQGLMVKELHSTSGIIIGELAYPKDDNAPK